MLPGLEGVAAALFGDAELGSPRSRFLPNYYQFRQPSDRLITNRDGIRFRVDVGTLAGWCVRFEIRDPSLEAYFALLRSGMTVVDVGANIGFTALTAAKRVEPAGRVLAFEPHGANHAALRANVELNPDLPIEAFNVGLGREAAKANMTEPDARNPGTNRITSDATGEAIVIERLDDFAEARGIDRIDAVKIDTEGFELEVLAGMERLLQESRPALFVELSEANLIDQGASTGQLLSYLAELGYDVRESLTGELMEPDADYDGLHCDGIALARS